MNQIIKAFDRTIYLIFRTNSVLQIHQKTSQKTPQKGSENTLFWKTPDFRPFFTPILPLFQKTPFTSLYYFVKVQMDFYNTIFKILTFFFTKNCVGKNCFGDPNHYSTKNPKLCPNLYNKKLFWKSSWDGDYLLTPILHFWLF